MLDQSIANPRFGECKRWYLYCMRETATGFAAFKQKVFERDQHRCYHCGFVAKSHMRVLNYDGNFRNNTLSNLYTVCPLCFWSLFADFSCSGMKKRGVLIHMPEMTQSHLNGLMHAAFCSISASTAHEESAEEMLKTLRLRAKPVEQAYGEGRSDPAVFSQMVLNALNVDAALSSKILVDLRWLPLMTGFTDEIKEWSVQAVEGAS